MPVRPSVQEEEYFARQELERRRKSAQERQAGALAEEREQERPLYFMRCPKCGMPLEEIAFSGVPVDKCSGCGGLWLDIGEAEILLQ